MSTPRICLMSVATLVLAFPIAGCCRDVPDDEYDMELQGELMGDELGEARDAADTDEERCKAACEKLVVSANFESVLSCEATGTDAFVDQPWDPANTSTTIVCTAHVSEPGFCTGRRPRGHREPDITLGSRAAWFVAHAHLERASVAAFGELAAWLQDHAAPTELIDRCRAAAIDEVVHADAIEALARREGAELQEPAADPVTDDLFAVAVHNAVEGCVSEAFAALIASHQASHAEDPALRALFATIAADELRHGQLAWDLHAWLWDQLVPAQQRAVAQAQEQALARLPAVIRANARLTPPGLGWPTPGHAAILAERFAGRIAADAGLLAAA